MNKRYILSIIVLMTILSSFSVFGLDFVEPWDNMDFVIQGNNLCVINLTGSQDVRTYHFNFSECISFEGDYEWNVWSFRNKDPFGDLKTAHFYVTNYLSTGWRQTTGTSTQFITYEFPQAVNLNNATWNFTGWMTSQNGVATQAYGCIELFTEADNINRTVKLNLGSGGTISRNDPGICPNTGRVDLNIWKLDPTNYYQGIYDDDSENFKNIGFNTNQLIQASSLTEEDFENIKAIGFTVDGVNTILRMTHFSILDYELAPYCGDGDCDFPSETYLTCPVDCDSFCGDGICDNVTEIHYGNCPEDCDSYCGDGYCNPETETNITCSEDCGEPGSDEPEPEDNKIDWRWLILLAFVLLFLFRNKPEVVFVALGILIIYLGAGFVWWLWILFVLLLYLILRKKNTKRKRRR